MKRIDKQTWWPELIELKDSLSLRELSERFGASPAAIANALKRNGIKRKAAQAGPRKAKKTVSKPKPKKRPGRPSVLDDFQHKMGTLVDREIAEMAGVTVSAVTNYRRRHNIKASTSRGRPRKPAVSGANLVSSRRSVSSGSIKPRGRSLRSMTVTSQPRCAKTVAYSMAMTPAPSTERDLGM